jgi:hypothetical protein
MDHPDGGELIYDMALKYAKELPPEYIFMEIGCWKGGSTMALMQAVKDSGVDRWVWSVDPYGSKPFRLGDGVQESADYNDTEVYPDAMENFANFAKQLGVKHYHWRLTSHDFFNIIDGVDFYDNGETIDKKFGFVYIDGDHDGDVVQEEMNWLIPRMPKSESMIVLDDTPYITVNNHPVIQTAIDEGMNDNFRTYWIVK